MINTLLLDIIPYSIAGIAQLVEHLIRNEGVVGSSPITGTRYKKIPKWGFFILYLILIGKQILYLTVAYVIQLQIVIVSFLCLLKHIPHHLNL